MAGLLTDEEILKAMQTAHPIGEEYPMWREISGRLKREIRNVLQAQLNKDNKRLADKCRNCDQVPVEKTALQVIAEIEALPTFYKSDRTVSFSVDDWYFYKESKGVKSAK